MISDKTIEQLQEAVKAQVVQLPDGRIFSSERGELVNLPRPEAEFTADPLVYHTLGGLVDYMNANPDGIEKPLIQITNYDQVNITTPLFGARRQREIPALAEFNYDQFRFGTWHTLEDFNIGLQALFVETEHRTHVLRLVGNIVESEVTTHIDDGVTQSVTAQTGIARVEFADVPRIVMLAPYRTFADIEQPVSPFLLRLRKGGKQGEPPMAALFECDGKRWQLDALQGIHFFLAEHLTDKSIPIFR